VTQDEVSLRHMLDATDVISGYVAVGRARFLAETDWQDAVIRRLEIIGEATERLSPDLHLALLDRDLIAKGLPSANAGRARLKAPGCQDPRRLVRGHPQETRWLS